MPAQSSQPGHLDGSKEQPVILDDDDDTDEDDDDDDVDDGDGDDDPDNSSGGGIFSDSNAAGIGRELGPPPSPTTPHPISMSSSSHDPSLHPSAASHNHSQEDQAIQQDDGCISREMSEQPSCPAPILADNKGNKIEKEQQPQKAGEDGEQGGCDSDTSSNGDVDDESYLQDSNKSEGLPPAKQRRSSLSCEPTLRRSCKRRLQHFDDGASTMRSLQQQHQEMGEEKDQEGHDSDSIGGSHSENDSHSGSDSHSRSDHDHRDDQDSDDSEGLRPAKRHWLSRSSNDPTSKRS